MRFFKTSAPFLQDLPQCCRISQERYILAEIFLKSVEKMRHLNAFGGGNARTLHRRSSTGGLAAMAARPCHACVSLCDSLPGNMWTITFCDLSNAFSGIMYFSTQHAQLCTFDHFCRQESTLVIQYISQRAKNAGWTPKF